MYEFQVDISLEMINVFYLSKIGWKNEWEKLKDFFAGK